ncbi:MAG: S26 family signal peptidase [Flavobacteriaceae bacterium]
MKKTIRILVIFFGVILTTYSFLATLNIFKIYKNPSTANEPNLPLNSRMLVTNLIKPELGDFICFEHEDEMFGEFIKVNRLVAKANDRVEIKNGILFINEKKF